MARSSLRPIITLVIFTFALWRIVQCTVVLRDNGYEGLTFAIHSSVAEDPRLIQNIMDLMTSASEVLYNATHQSTFFRDVTIVVPADWTPVSFVDDDGHETSTSEGGGGCRFEAAEVRVDHPNPAYGNIPYTRQVGACGEPGTFIHITPDFIRELHGATAEEFGEPGRTFVHEWSHLRYGVFDEYTNDDDDDRSPPIYIDDDGNVQMTGCFKHDCVTCDQVNESSSSVMYLPFLPKADGFCGDSEDRPHNAAAPNAHNLMCEGRSTWEVILSHPDFADGRNMRRLRDLKTTPRFRVVQQRTTDSGIYVLLLDVSGSMSGGRIAMLRRSAARFITAQIPDGARLGMIAFSNAPIILSNLTVVTKDNRDELVAMLPLEDDGGNTGIGSAIRSALHMLNSNRNSTSSAEGSVIILITDGEENVAPYVRGIVSELVDSKAVVNTVAFGRSASSHLEVLVKSTGGRGFFYENADDFARHDSALESAFFESATTQADVELRPVQLHRSDVIVSIGGNISERVFVDDEIRRNVNFNFGYIDDIDVVLADPNGTTYSSRDSDHVFFTDDPLSRIFTFRIPMATTGSWTYMIRNRSGFKQGLSVTVTSEPVNVREQPIRIRARMNDVTVRFPDDVTKTKIYAEIFKGYLPVLDALAIATVERPSGSAVELLLKDDGIAADLTKDDGVYTAFFSQYNGTGRYSVTARVVNDGRARLQVGSVASASPARRKYLATATMRTTSERLALKRRRYTVTLGDFQRTANAGSFRVSGWVANEDVIPPNRVTDLRATNFIDDFGGIRAIKLTWTSPGDDLDRGTASRLEVSAGSLRRTMTRVLTSESVLNGSLQPVIGGQTHTILLRRDQTTPLNHTLHFAVRFWDDVGNPSQMSNVATVYVTNILRRQSSEAIFGRQPAVIFAVVVVFTAFSLPLMGVLTLLFRYCCCRRNLSHRKVKVAPVSIIRFFNEEELPF